MNAIDAAAQVLAKAGMPLSYREITRDVLEAGLWQTKGKTPEATIHALLAVDIADQGAVSRFQRTGSGVFALRMWGLPEVAARRAKLKAPPSPIPMAPTEAQPAVTAVGLQPEALSSSPPAVSMPASESAPKKAQAFSFMDAAELVLDEHSGGKPMHYRAITTKVLNLGLVNTKGLTPEATIYAQILTDTKRRARRVSRFTERVSVVPGATLIEAGCGPDAVSNISVASSAMPAVRKVAGCIIVVLRFVKRDLTHASRFKHYCTGAVMYVYSAARSSSVILAAFFQGMVSGKGRSPGRMPVRIISTNSASL